MTKLIKLSKEQGKCRGHGHNRLRYAWKGFLGFVTDFIILAISKISPPLNIKYDIKQITSALIHIKSAKLGYVNAHCTIEVQIKISIWTVDLLGK